MIRCVIHGKRSAQNARSGATLWLWRSQIPLLYLVSMTICTSDIDDSIHGIRCLIPFGRLVVAALAGVDGLDRGSLDSLRGRNVLGDGVEGSGGLARLGDGLLVRG